MRRRAGQLSPESDGTTGPHTEAEWKTVERQRGEQMPWPTSFPSSHGTAAWSLRLPCKAAGIRQAGAIILLNGPVKYFLSSVSSLMVLSDCPLPKRRQEKGCLGGSVL